MIHNYTFKNFYSFLKEATVDLEVNNKAPLSESYIKSRNNGRITKVLAITGANATGKTNALRVIPFIKWVLTESFSQNKSRYMPFVTFGLPDNRKPTDLSVTFETQKNVFKYSLTLNKNIIESESLKIWNHKTNRYASLFQREFKSNNYVYKFSEELSSVAKFRELVPPNASFLSVVEKSNNKYISDIFDYWHSIYCSIAYTDILHERKSADDNENSLIEFLEENKAIKLVIIDLLKKYDIGMHDLLTFTEDDEKQKNKKSNAKYSAFGFHKFLKNEFIIPYELESSGTRRLIHLLKIMLVAIKKGSVAIIDEFDNVLHPNMVNELINLFTSKDINENNAQFIFTTHQYHIFNKLDKYQILMVEKEDRKGSSIVWRLDSIKGIRPDENLHAKYFSGAYGGLPNI